MLALYWGNLTLELDLSLTRPGFFFRGFGWAAAYGGSGFVCEKLETATQGGAE